MFEGTRGLVWVVVLSCHVSYMSCMSIICPVLSCRSPSLSLSWPGVSGPSWLADDDDVDADGGC